MGRGCRGADGTLRDGIAGAAALLVVLSLSGGMAAADAAPAAASRAGALSLKVAGLPRGERARLAIVGPGPGGRGRQRRSLRVGARRTLGRLPAGRYRVFVAKLRMRRGHGSIERGALATPVRRRMAVVVRPRRAAKVEVRFGTIVNPGVRAVSGRVVEVRGDAASPTDVALKGSRGLRPGAILSARPTDPLPAGLLARVLSVQRRGALVWAKVTPASIYEVAPNMSFDVPLATTEGSEALASGLLKCGPSASDSFSPFVRISNVRLTGRWTTAHVLFAEITNGAVVEVHFKAGAGVDVAASRGFSCEVPLPAFALQGMAGPIPVYGGIRPKAKGEIAARGSIHTEGSTDVTLGTSVKVPNGASPIFNFGSPSFTLGSDVFVGVKAELGLDAELGIGAANAANLHLAVGNSFAFSAGAGSCSWDLDLGTFGVGGKVGPVTIHGPSSPPLVHHNLWQAPCGPAAPAPPSSSPPAPASGPLTRATMSWSSDSDIDLYTWDSQGNATYFGELNGIPNAQLIEDVIPGEGEDVHGREYFQETADFNRTYTFGICDYRGDGGDVTLTVADPGGSTRTFQHTLGYEGDSAVITSSPLGVDYSPPWDWCQYLGD